MNSKDSVRDEIVDGAPSNSDHILSLYSGLMEEIKVRVSAIDFAISGKLSVHPRVAYEIAYLQLRLICELIALACLLVQGDTVVAKSARLKKAYQADFIVRVLSEIHPDFYPKPTRQVHDSEGKVVETKPITSGYLTQQDLVKLWRECGEVLHRGSAENVTLTLNEPKSFEPIEGWRSKIIALLNHHQIALLNSTTQIWVLMNAKDDGRVYAHVFALVKNPNVI